MPSSNRRAGVFALPALFLLMPLLAAQASRADKPADLQTQIIQQARWRSLGPAIMGGRIADIAVEEKNSYTFYIALATGGLLKTENNGNTWTPVFEKQEVASVGAVAIAPSDSKIVWVGTGEANGRNSSSWGDGVYKSTDSGKTWKNMGLKDSQEIGRIAIDPADPNVVFVAAAGHLWGANRERGIFKTTDGGKTWQHSLAIDADTGAIDVVLGAPGSHVVYAATYNRRRYPWGFRGIGPGSGLYKSSDDGKTWKKLTAGLPTEQIGRIGLAVARSKPGTVYAVIESPRGGATNLFNGKSRYGGVFRSDDSGETWKRMSETSPRGFYFGQIRVDPTNADRVYVLGFDLAVSEDGGKTFKTEGYSENVHSDLHALWIDPAHPERLLLGTDGGLYASYDRAHSWENLNNFAAGEFYEVSVDNRKPFWVYGGLQDNGCWAGPSALLATGGPINGDWKFLNGGDGFYALPDPHDPDIVYSESQGGAMERLDRRTNMRKSMYPEAAEGTPAFRFNWNSPVCASRHMPDTIYIGGNRVFKFTHKGREWDAISPDLSRQHGDQITAAGSGAETYGTIVTLTESPLRKGLLWAGTDDGCVQRTDDEGATWTDVSNALPGEVRTFYVKRIEASHFQALRAFVAIDGHRSDNFAPHLFMTEDGGKSWKSIVGDLPPHGPVLTVREDPVNPDLLFVGTEFGAFASLDRGNHWRKLDSGLPTVAVDDLAIQPRDHALVAATHGRSLFVLDNIGPLEEFTPQVANAEIHLFASPPALEYLPEYKGMFTNTHEFQAQNPPDGVEIVYWMKSLADAPPQIAITDAAGKSVANLSGERFPGLARLRWNMRTGGGRRFDPEGALFVKPGVYTITLTVGKEKQSQKVTVTGAAELSEAPSDAPFLEEKENGEAEKE